MIPTGVYLIYICFFHKRTRDGSILSTQQAEIIKTLPFSSRFVYAEFVCNLWLHLQNTAVAATITTVPTS